MKRLAPVALFLVGVAAAFAGLTALRSFEPPRGERELLYLPNGKYLRLASLGHSTLMADLVYLWAIQHYSGYERGERYRYVEHVFRNVIPDLDPRYLDAYAIGSLVLSVETRDVEAALRVLDRGIEENPDEWLLPWMAGWECHHAGLPGRAIRYFDRAVLVPGAPAAIQRHRAGMVDRAGELRGSYRLWRDLYDDPDSDPATRAIAERRMLDLHVRIDLQDLTAAIAVYRERAGRNPRAIHDLVRAGILRDVPRDPDGAPYLYDAASGSVSSAAGRVLGDR